MDMHEIYIQRTLIPSFTQSPTFWPTPSTYYPLMLSSSPPSQSHRTRGREAFGGPFADGIKCPS
jgi:hypothetical protein